MVRPFHVSRSYHILLPIRSNPILYNKHPNLRQNLRWKNVHKTFSAPPFYTFIPRICKGTSSPDLYIMCLYTQLFQEGSHSSSGYKHSAVQTSFIIRKKKFFARANQHRPLLWSGKLRNTFSFSYKVSCLNVGFLKISGGFN